MLFGETVTGGDNAARPLPPCPTMALPGSHEKIEVMRWRYGNGYHLHHPADAKFESDRLTEARWLQVIALLRMSAEMREVSTTI